MTYLSTWKVLGGTCKKDEDFGKSAPFYFCLIMKKLFTFIFISLISFNVIHAEITWTLSDDGTFTISGTDMPDYYAAPWYSQRRKIKKVVIEKGVTNIGNNAFSECDSLISITIPNSVTRIGDGAFGGCYRLTSITIPNSVTSIGYRAFISCSNLTSINIPNSVTSIGDGAFQRCNSLTSITIPNSVTSIGYRTFEDCRGLSSVTIPNSVTKIGSCAFMGCRLTSVTIPKSVESIGKYAFRCSRLTSITCEASTPPSCYDSKIFGVDNSIPVYVPANSIDTYKEADVWKDFTNIQAIPAHK